MLKTLKAELKVLNKVGKTTKKQPLDATGVINIDEFIEKQRSANIYSDEHELKKLINQILNI